MLPIVHFITYCILSIHSFLPDQVFLEDPSFLILPLGLALLLLLWHQVNQLDQVVLVHQALQLALDFPASLWLLAILFHPLHLEFQESQEGQEILAFPEVLEALFLQSFLLLQALLQVQVSQDLQDCQIHQGDQEVLSFLADLCHLASLEGLLDPGHLDFLSLLLILLDQVCLAFLADQPSQEVPCVPLLQEALVSPKTNNNKISC